MARDTSNLELHLPRDMAFTCHNSGVCCSVFDSIPVDEPAVAAIGALDRSALNHLAGNAPDHPIYKAADNDVAAQPVLTRRSCGSCSMLTADHKCAVHAIAGEAAKPQACQDFPWRYVETPGGVYVGLSFVCPSVRGNRGQLVADQEQDLARRYARAASVREAPAEIALNSRRNLRWSDYLAVEAALLDLLAHDAEPLSVRLIACCLLPGFLDQTILMVESTEASPASVSEIIESLRQRQYDLLFRLARKNSQRHSARPRRMFLGMLASFANTLQRSAHQGRLYTVSSVMAQYARSAAGFGGIRLRPVETPVPKAVLDRASLPGDGPVAQQITRYLRHCIERKDLVLGADINRRMRLLAVNAVLIAWYAAAFKHEATHLGQQPTDNPWDQAIVTVERLFGFHSTFYQFFERNRAFSDIVDSFLLKPGFPYILLR